LFSINRYQSTGAGTEARQAVYAEITPYLGKMIETVNIKLTKRPLTPYELSLPIQKRTEIEKKITSHKEIQLENFIFSGVVSNISPYNNFSSLISQIRSGATVCHYSQKQKSISLCYPKIDASNLSSEYPRIEELRKITSELENRDTRQMGIEKYQKFFDIP
jgi:hypothetical protein